MWPLQSLYAVAVYQLTSLAHMVFGHKIYTDKHGIGIM